MKRLVFAVIGLLFIVAFVGVACVEEEPVGPVPEEGEGVASSCVTCHSNKDILKEVATVPEEEEAEEPAGEG